MAANTEGFTNETIAMLLKDEGDQKLLSHILSGKRIKNEQRRDAERVATLFVERAIVSINIDSVFASTRQDVIEKTLMFSGLNDKGDSLVSPNVAQQAFEKMLPMAFGGGGEPDRERLFNSNINEAMLMYLYNSDNTGFTELAKKNLDNYLTPEKSVILFQRAIDERLEVDVSKDDLLAKAKELSLDVSVQEKKQETPDLENPEPAEKNDEAPAPDMEARLGTNATMPDSGELASAAEAAHLRYKLDVERRTDALLSLNKIMDNNPTWVNRSVVDKIKTKASTMVDSALARNPLVYPSESLFGETLSSVDASGRVEQEFVRYNNNALFGFKAKFASPKVPPQAYEATALRLRAEGVKTPYVKSSFKDPQTANFFMTSMVDALVKSGYDIDEIKVSKNLEPFFEAYKVERSPEYSVGEAPNNDYEEKNDDIGPAQKVKDADTERRYDENPGLKEAEELIQQLKDINEPLLNIHNAMEDPTQALKLSDVSDEDLINVLSKAPLLKFAEEGWNQAIQNGGVLPSSKKIVNEVFGEFKKNLTGADPRGLDEGGKFKSGDNQIKRLIKAKDVLYDVFPEDSHHHITRILKHQAERLDIELEPSFSTEPTPESGPAPVEPESGPAPVEPESGPAPSDIDMGEYAGEPAPSDVDMGEYAGEPAPSDVDMGQYAGGPAPSDVDEKKGKPGEAVQQEWDSAFNEYQTSRDTPPLSSYEEEPGLEQGYGDEPAMPSAASFMEPVDEPQNDAPQNDASPRNDDIGDVDNGFSLSKEKWSSILGKEFSEIPENLVRDIVAMTPKERLLLNMYGGDDNWDFESLDEIKNTMKTIHLVTSPMILNADNLGVREMEFIASIPEDLVPDTLMDARNEHINKVESELNHSVDPDNSVPEEPEVEEPTVETPEAEENNDENEYLRPRMR